MPRFESAAGIVNFSGVRHGMGRVVASGRRFTTEPRPGPGMTTGSRAQGGQGPTGQGSSWRPQSRPQGQGLARPLDSVDVDALDTQPCDPTRGTTSADRNISSSIPEVKNVWALRVGCGPAQSSMMDKTGSHYATCSGPTGAWQRLPSRPGRGGVHSKAMRTN